MRSVGECEEGGGGGVTQGQHDGQCQCQCQHEGQHEGQCPGRSSGGGGCLWMPPKELQKTTVHVSLEESHEVFFPMELTDKDYMR
jgi:hypothetical protein